MFKKKALFAMLLAAVMLLSGCSLVMRDSEVDALQTIIDVNGVKVDKATFMSAYNYNLYMQQYYAQMMAQFGLSGSEVNEAEVRQNTVDSYISGLVQNQKAEELGFKTFTDAERAEIEAEAQQEYDNQLANIKENDFAETDLEGEALEAAVAAHAQELGYTLESIRDNVENEKISNRLTTSVTDQVTVDDEDLQAALDAKIESDKASCETNLGAYGTKANAGTVTYYTPAGYRSMRMISLPKAAADNADAEQEAANAEAKAKAEELLARLDAGESFDALGEEADSRVVCESSTDVNSAVVAAVMALTEKGTHTDVIETENAYVLAEYVDDVAEHTATLAEMRDAIYNETLENAKNAAYDAALKEWIAAADVKVYLDRLD